MPLSSISLEEALSLAAQCRHAAKDTDIKIIAAVVDASGHLVALTRMDGAIAGGVDAALAKARCAVLYQRPTSAFADSYRTGKPVQALPNVIPLGGGIPLWRHGNLIGALGVSGAVEETETALAERVIAQHY
ncbi:GlcG/HbpS family heme-binding protein [Halomonas sp. V046]|uniref:GlcG/HbpS family heme-binding protein n=1 Tax=Halomonas sp. V046 TaxID=3459611 RepID=UPI004044AEA6